MKLATVIIGLALSSSAFAGYPGQKVDCSKLSTYDRHEYNCFAGRLWRKGGDHDKGRGRDGGGCKKGGGERGGGGRK